MLLGAAPVSAREPSPAEAADDALQRVEELVDGKGVRTGRELTPAIARLVRLRSHLDRGERAAAEELLDRPTGTPEVACSTHFCLHWTLAGNNAPDPTDSNGDGTPNYIERMKTAFERSSTVENTQMGWRRPVNDGDGRVDVYVKDIGDDGTYGYVSPDSSSSRTVSAFQVMDDDYAEFDGDPQVSMEVTAAHEYNHVLQYAYDGTQDQWMFESTAVWMEDHVFDDDNDWYAYMPRWALLPGQPMTFFANSTNGRKVYGSAIWNHWLERRCGPTVVRRAWELSQANTVDNGGFAPGTYNAALAEYSGGGGTGFAREFGAFAAATAEWQLAGSGIHEGAGFFPTAHNVTRSDDTLGAGTTLQPVIDHTGYVLIDVSSRDGAIMDFTGRVPAGVPSTIAVVGRDDESDAIRTVSTFLPAGGDYLLRLATPQRFDRITAVLVNASTAHGAYNGDWPWTQDDQQFSVKLTPQTFVDPNEVAAALAAENPPEVACAQPPPKPPVVTPTPTATPIPTPVPTATPIPEPEPDPGTSVRLSKASARVSSVRKRGRLPLFATVSEAGRLSVSASLDRRSTKRLKLKSRTLGKGRKTIHRASRVKLNVKLSSRIRRALRRQKKTLKVSLRATFVPADGGRAVTRKLTVRLKR